MRYDTERFAKHHRAEPPATGHIWHCDPEIWTDSGSSAQTETGTMPEHRDTLLDHYRKTRGELLAAIDGLSDAAMSDPSLDGWSVKDHLLHLASWDDIRAQEVERIAAGHASAWRMSEQQDAAFDEMAYELRRGLSPRQALWELRTSRQRLLNAIGDAPPSALDPSLYGEAGLVNGHEEQHTGWIKRWRAERRP
jgi:hypothetical protein